MLLFRLICITFIYFSFTGFELVAEDGEQKKSGVTYAGDVSPITDYLQFFDSRSHTALDTDKLKPESSSYTHQKLNGYNSGDETPGGIVLDLCRLHHRKSYAKLDFSPKKLLRSAYYSLTGFKEEDPCKLLVDYDQGKLQLKLSLEWK